MIQVFWYGTLINEESLKSTVPSAQKITPAILEDYIRVFETPGTLRFTKQGVPISTLNIKKVFINQVYYLRLS